MVNPSSTMYVAALEHGDLENKSKKVGNRITIRVTRKPNLDGFKENPLINSLGT